MHKQQKQDSTLPPLSVSEIAQASVAYSLFFNNAIYFVSFLLLSLGLSDEINIVIKFALAAILVKKKQQYEGIKGRLGKGGDRGILKGKAAINSHSFLATAHQWLSHKAHFQVLIKQTIYYYRLV